MKILAMGLLLLVGVYVSATELTTHKSSIQKEIPMKKLMFALKITDSDTYGRYRKSIKPLMDRLNVVVLEEVKLADVLTTQSGSEDINRLAVFGFPSEEVKVQFFSDPDYISAKPLFEASTSNFRKIIE